MAQFIKKLQNPYIKILLAPLAFIVFGIVVGMIETATRHWLNFLLLYIVVLSSELINHFFDLWKNRSQPAARFILIFLEVILIVATVILLKDLYWPIRVMLVTYLLYLHFQYFPYNMSKSIYGISLNTFFQGFTLNVVAYTTQTQHLTSTFIWGLFPLVLISLALNFEDLFLYDLFIFKRHQLPTFLTRYHSTIAFIIIVLGVFLGFYFSLPSQSFYLVQFLFVSLSLLLASPLLIRTLTTRSIQNKLNFFGSIHLIFALLYSLSYLF